MRRPQASLRNMSRTISSPRFQKINNYLNNYLYTSQIYGIKGGVRGGILPQIKDGNYKSPLISILRRRVVFFILCRGRHRKYHACCALKNLPCFAMLRRARTAYYSGTTDTNFYQRRRRRCRGVASGVEAVARKRCKPYKDHRNV